ncbi:lytic transglycosylase domain-containing protein [Rhodobacteraceae bacterium N5(2021)]|uniref:Lytic transglycosylase domain-containing protein n=1 Tax=Gymnodinialimonas phycosphaerae TaxID=2841589 RepID=A0A975TUT0_9RHOB|nr:lytic transglycosylase domain-containing protein [Gymnodinialimonas phycosphaerae]MBY4895046.1 lytic transglycosylase domain-containing protein [Gymnodinialimonas phycosphaerae]
MAKRMWGVAAFAVLLSGPALAQDGGIRFVRAPEAGQTGPRINIQITPEDMERQGAPAEAEVRLGAVAPAATGDTDAGSGGASAWFWAEIPSHMPADPARFWAAQEHLAIAPEASSLGAPRLDTVSRIAEAHGREILAATIGTQVSPAFALAVIAAESAGRTDAISGAGAQGLMQLIPATAERFGVEDAMDPAQNIAGGVAYLDWLMGEFDRDPILVLAAYNAGEGAVTRAGGVPNYDETRTYVPRVLSAWVMARGLCNTPPDLISDGCVFQLMN